MQSIRFSKKVYHDGTVPFEHAKDALDLEADTLKECSVEERDMIIDWVREEYWSYDTVRSEEDLVSVQLIVDHEVLDEYVGF